MNEPDLMNNKYQLHLAMEEARTVIPQVFKEYGELTGVHAMVEGYMMQMRGGSFPLAPVTILQDWQWIN